MLQSEASVLEEEVSGDDGNDDSDVDGNFDDSGSSDNGDFDDAKESESPAHGSRRNVVTGILTGDGMRWRRRECRCPFIAVCALRQR